MVPGRDVRLHGIVRDTAGRQVSLASMHVAMGGTIVVVPVGSDGRFERWVSRYDSAMTIVFSASAPQFSPTTKAVTIVRGGPDSLSVDFRLVPLPLPPAGDFTGRGVAGGRARGVIGGTPLPTGSYSVTRQEDFSGRGAIAHQPGDPVTHNTEEYNRIEENPFVSASSEPLSTFGADVDGAAYSNVRRYVCGGSRPPRDAVRIEEMINYFPYRYPAPTGADPIAIAADMADAPWSATHTIVRVALQSRHVSADAMPPSNLVFLIDVSGSMMGENRLPLVKQAFLMLLAELGPRDRVAIVTYAGAAGLALPSTPASEKETIRQAIARLEAGGSTAGGAGIQLAYDVAREHRLIGGNNRVILATDGDFNVGVSSTSDLLQMVEARRKEGTYLTVLGFGMGNIKDGRLEQLADLGNGNYAYIDDITEARKVFVTQMRATLLTVANDVKIQVEFNPRVVQAYRLIGYENRSLAARDFTNDTRDAGEIGAGHAVTALYEVVLVGTPLDVALGRVPSLRYQGTELRPTAASEREEVLTVSVRYKTPGAETSRLIQRTVANARTAPNADFRFALAVAGYGMVLRDSPHKGSATLDQVLTLARGAVGDDPEYYRAEFISIVNATRDVRADR
jgi:Ca-activated chloride channel family protein